jgi:hypothetical protein
MRRVILALALIAACVTPVLAAAHVLVGYTTVVWEVPAKTRSVIVEVFDEKNKYVTYYTVSSYTTIKPGYKLRVTARTR